MKALTPDQAAACGALGCRNDPYAVVRHPAYGKRTVCAEHTLDLLSRSPDSPPQGRESGGAVRERSERTRAECPEARERRSRRKRPPEAGADPEARPQGGPSGADLDKRCGAVAVAVVVAVLLRRRSRGGAYRTLHYASARERSADNGRENVSIPIQGGSS